MSVLLDSCILIDFLAGREAARGVVTGGPAAISVISWMEVLVGARGPDEEALVRGFLSGFETLPIDAAVAEQAVSLRRTRRLKLPDAIILATAIASGRTLVTRNTRDFDPARDEVVVPYTV